MGRRHLVSMVRSIMSASNSCPKRDIVAKYEEAVKALNTLQTNAQALNLIRSQRDKLAHLNIPNMVKYAQRAGMSMADLDKLSVIHVSGTKGKGSTCAYCESILRHKGYKTGFYSSPHLVEVRERIRLNGEPLPRENFTKYFWEVFNKLQDTKEEHNGAMPNYFAFLTVLSFHVFLREKVDVAIMEVGIGGQYDCTNVIRSPVVCGVSSLGLDHVSILGHTIDKIAWHKGGIFKPGVPAITAPQPPEAMEVLQQRAAEVGTTLRIVPDMKQYYTEGRQIQLGIKGKMQAVNASLALQLCNIWETTHNKDSVPPSPVVTSGFDVEPQVPETSDVLEASAFPLSQETVKGLKVCEWRGRNQTLRKPGLTYYLDGAHTVESIEQCVEWFMSDSESEANTIKSDVYRVLLFNTSGDRESEVLLQPLTKCWFDAVLFCPNVAFLAAVSADQTNNTVTRENQLNRCLINRNAWNSLHAIPEPVQTGNQGITGKHPSTEIDCDVPVKVGKFESGDSAATHSINGINSIENQSNTVHDATSGSASNITCDQEDLLDHSDSSTLFRKDGYENSTTGRENGPKSIPKNNCKKTRPVVHVLPSIAHALQWATKGREALPSVQIDMPEIPEDFKRAEHTQILITGSIHLVGGVLRIVDVQD